ncbi:MAG: BON domain-containing protein [Candidatus Limnocylindria bacterium]
MDQVDDARREIDERLARDRSGPAGTLVLAGIAAGAGAAAAYLFDPDRGRARRAIARDRLSALVRRGVRQTERAGRTVSAQAQGITRRITHLRSDATPILDDASLGDKVRSELFRDEEIPKGQININVEHGVVVLRGQLETPEQIAEIESRVRRIGGVWDVENLMHLPGLPSPEQSSARSPA